MINTSAIPQYTGSFEELEKAASGLWSEAAGIRRNGMDVHSRFQMLAGVYVAPEAEDLLGTTKPVMDESEAFATKLETVAAALDSFIVEARPLAQQLETVKADAEAFFVEVADDEGWQDDDDKRERHNALDARIRAAVDAFQEAERRAANKIAALVGDVRFVGATGSDTVLRGMHDITYGIAPGEIKDASKLPWGEPIAESHDWNDFGYWSKSFFWDGLVVDNIWGSLKGLGALATGDGEAWKGLASVASGVSAWVSEPYDELMDATMGEDGEKDDDRNKKALKEFGKALVGWDMWDENPARAASTVVFNGLTLGAGPLAAAGRVGRGGALSKGATVAGNVGMYLDPLSAGIVGTAKVSQALPRLAELTNHLRSTDALPAAPDPHTLLELGNSRVRVDGEFTVVDKHGRPVEHAAPKELSAEQRANATQHSREPAAVGATPRGAEASHVGGQTGPSRVPPPPSAVPGQAGQSGLPSSHGSGQATGGAGYGNSGAGHGLTRDEVVRRQARLASSDPDWRREHYYRDGRRVSEEGVDDLGEPLAQMDVTPGTGEFNPSSKQAPPPPPYHGPAQKFGPDTASPEALQKLHRAAAVRQNAIDADMAAQHRLDEAQRNVDSDPSPANDETLKRAEKDYAKLHTAQGKASERFGEQAAELHAIQQHYPGAIREPILGPKNGNDQFDQVYRLPDGKYVVVEAKSKTTTPLGQRTLPDGKKVRQGTLEYFNDIIKQMDARGKPPAGATQEMIEAARYEKQLARKLRLALAQGKIDYVVVKGVPVNGSYGGYSIRRFKTP